MNVNYTQLKTFLSNTRLKVKLKQVGKSLLVPSTSGYNDFYLNFLQDTFNFQIKKAHSFFACAILAIAFLNRNTPDCFFDLPGKFIGQRGVAEGKPKPRFFSKKADLYPYMLVTIRSGIVFLRVDGPKNFKILDGSNIGASTYLGLLKLLTSYKYPEEALRDANIGDNSTVDLSVGDIYGGDYLAIGLASHVIASTFCKVRGKRKNELERIKDCDISKSLLSAVTGNMLQIGYLLATLENLSTMVLMGPYFDAPTFMQMGTATMAGMSKGKISLIFLKHSSYLGSLGVYLNNYLQKDRANSL
eukprot:TRINITY_DN2057_c0_g1_i4.p1 TRINITY_DN2057_c0_g1~~TRINITY_DN2057_c0_g1_i4.p1  ORF type:complete len:302 (+),score=70.56 TRINITY_DN2057_c0_g1_i4:599-1504(+)